MNRFTLGVRNVMCAMIFATFIFGDTCPKVTVADEVASSPAARMYVQFLSEKIDSRVSVEKARFWIGQLESVLQDSEDPNISYHIIFSLANLYAHVNDKPVSERLFFQIFRSENAPGELRLAAGNNLLAGKQVQTLSSSPEYLDFFVQFDGLIGGFSQEVRKKYLHDLQKNRVLCADLLVETGKKESSLAGRDEESDLIMYNAYTEASKLLSKFLEEFPLLDQNQKSDLILLNFGADSVLFRLGQIKYELGLLSLKHGKQQDGLIQFDSAVEILTKLLKEHGDGSLFVARSFVLILNVEEAKDNTDGKQFLRRLKEMMPYIQNMSTGLHTVHNSLLDKAMAMSKEGTRSVASDIYTILIEREKKYFPNEYASHINYQVGLASMASNYAEIGDVKRMQQSVDELRSCTIADPETSKLINSLLENAKERIEFTRFAFEPHSSERVRHLILSISLAVLGGIMILWGLYLVWTKEKQQ